MSEQEQNIDLIKKGYEAFNVGDGDTVIYRRIAFAPSATGTRPGDQRQSWHATKIG